MSAAQDSPEPDTTAAPSEGEESRGKSRGPHRLNSETAKLAAQKSAEVRKAKAAQRRSAASGAVSSAIQDGEVGILVPVPYVEVIRVLTRQAKAGDVAAARELRAWKEQHPEVNEHVELDAQPAVIRDRLLRRLLAEVQEGDAAGDGQVPPVDALTPTDSPEELGRSAEREATPAKSESREAGAPEAPQ